MIKSQLSKGANKLREPGFKKGLFFFASGILTSVPLTLFIDQFDENFLTTLPLFYATLIPVIVVAPFLEEFAKAFPLFYRTSETAKSIFVLGCLVGLGFGICEFFTYVIVLGVPLIVRLPGVVFHASSTSITSYGIATRRPAQYYFVSVLLHFSNNFFAVFPYAVDSSSLIGPWSLGLVAVTPATFYISYTLYKRIRREL